MYAILPNLKDQLRPQLNHNAEVAVTQSGKMFHMNYILRNESLFPTSDSRFSIRPSKTRKKQPPQIISEQKYRKLNEKEEKNKIQILVQPYSVFNQCCLPYKLTISLYRYKKVKVNYRLLLNSIDGPGHLSKFTQPQAQI